MKKIQSALISVFYKDGLEPLLKTLNENGVTIYSTGGTQKFIEDKGYSTIGVENITSYPSILGGRVKTLHPNVFGGILGRRDLEQDLKEMKEYKIPEIDLVIVDLYPFEETLKNTNEESLIIEKIDIGGPSMIRAAAKNFKDIVAISDKSDYETLNTLLQQQEGSTTKEQRKHFAAKAFHVAMNYDIAINNYFNEAIIPNFNQENVLRYGENPHQNGTFYGDIQEVFTKLNGKELSYNNIVDANAAVELILDFKETNEAVFAIIKHTNVCGIAQKPTVSEAWDAALAGDPESAFGGVLITNKNIDLITAEKINNLFFEILIAPSFDEDALELLKSKKNRNLLILNPNFKAPKMMFKNALNGILTQAIDEGNFLEWKEEGGRKATDKEKEDLIFGNIVVKHLKSNAIAIVKNKQLLGKGAGQTSRIDALRHAIEKAKSFNFDMNGASMTSDAFFPFDDCVKMAKAEGIHSVLQPGGSIRDKDSIDYCKENNMALILTGMRHFKH